MKLIKHNIRDRAVSPLIGVILMVGITVILSATVGTFVLDIGTTPNDSPPKIAFDVEQGEIHTKATGGNEANLRSVNITLIGGESPRISSLNVTVNGEQAYDIKRNAHRKSNSDSEKFPFEEMGDTFSVGETVRIVHKHHQAFADDRTTAYKNRQGYSNSDDANPSRAKLYPNNHHSDEVQLEPGDIIRITYQSADGTAQILYEYEVR